MGDLPNDDNDINRKVEGSLAWPGRDRVDPRAPYFFSKEISESLLSTERYKSGAWHQQTDHASLKYGDQVVRFWEIADEGEQCLPPDATYERQAWLVGVAANPWRAVENSRSGVRQRLAHWGIYILPQNTNDQEPSYRIFGMNFQKEYKGELMLEDVWGTSGEDGTGAWKKRISSNEFHKVDDPSLKERVMYFSLEEFVLTDCTQVQFVLRRFVRQLRWTSEGDIQPHRGDAYSLLAANCQHFARKVIKTLVENSWEDPSRLEHRFQLAGLETTIRQALMKEAENEEGEYALRRRDNGSYRNSAGVWVPGNTGYNMPPVRQ
ncbi:hypothetical protein FAUST_7281 [Fusarium austroamericanum]|uniref:PPPDE domain-containing protein n=1 Tax=Fusarium austroamericanum TaxID=282268 RepID=A0AAN6BZ04_FUSAU|nr:hypothetical protein FAUST_7281 [Fusarium austroamericanum]